MKTLIRTGMLLALLSAAPFISSQEKTAVGADTPARVESNQIYGMYSGLALLMDVHHPQTPNGYGVIMIPGSGWMAPTTYDAQPLKKNTRQVLAFVPPLLKAGYTVFVIDHRASPRFRYPAAVEDAQRAVRFIRHNAKAFGIDPDHIGGMGYSSGAHLVSMLGTLDGKGDAADPDAVNQESAKLQCVVAGGLPADLTNPKNPQGAEYSSTFLGMPTFADDPPASEAYKKYHEASPINHVSATSAPEMMFHGTADPLVEIEQAERMDSALIKAGVPEKLVKIPGGTHYQLIVKNGPDFLGDMVKWFDQYLRNVPAAK